MMVKNALKALDLEVPWIDPLLDKCFLQWLHDDCFVIVGDTAWNGGFNPPTNIVNYAFLTSVYLSDIWSYKNPCGALNMYPLDLEDHWFGFHMDYTGLAFPVQYKKPATGDIAVVTVCGRWTFDWVHGDEGLVKAFVLPMLIMDMLKASRFELNRSYDDEEWDAIEQDLTHYRLNLLEALKI